MEHFGKYSLHIFPLIRRKDDTLMSVSIGLAKHEYRRQVETAGLLCLINKDVKKTTFYACTGSPVLELCAISSYWWSLC